MNIERSYTCMKCRNAFTKGHLNVCLAKELICNICKYKGHFGRLCKNKERKPALKTVEEVLNSQNCSYSPEDPQARIEENFCAVIKFGQKRGSVTTTIIPFLTSEPSMTPMVWKPKNWLTLDWETTR